MKSITQFITQKLNLKVNESKSAVAKPQERKFLGFSLNRTIVTLQGANLMPIPNFQRPIPRRRDCPPYIPAGAFADAAFGVTHASYHLASEYPRSSERGSCLITQEINMCRVGRSSDEGQTLDLWRVSDSVGGRQVGTDLAISLFGKPTLPFLARQVASETGTGLVSQIVRTPEPKRRGVFVVPG